jgi:hypothetical protein
MKFLTAIMGKTKTESEMHTSQKSSRMEKIQNQIEENRLRWFRNVKRMNEHTISKRLLEKT